jgi:hypothetical protein
LGNNWKLKKNINLIQIWKHSLHVIPLAKTRAKIKVAYDCKYSRLTFLKTTWNDISSFWRVFAYPTFKVFPCWLHLFNLLLSMRFWWQCFQSMKNV